MLIESRRVRAILRAERRAITKSVVSRVRKGSVTNVRVGGQRSPASENVIREQPHGTSKSVSTRPKWMKNFQLGGGQPIWLILKRDALNGAYGPRGKRGQS
jgi:hypothetical protein